MKDQTPITVFWFRRDLRLNDNAGLYHALKSGLPVLPVFIFDRNILNKLEDRDDRRVTFIYDQIRKLKAGLKEKGSDLVVYYSTPEDAWNQLVSGYNIRHVFTNRDYEPYAVKRDEQIRQKLNASGITFKTTKDQCIFEYDEVLKEDGTPYTVFTPYSKKWKAKLNDFYLKSYPSEQYLNNLLHVREQEDLIPLSKMGFEQASFTYPPPVVEQSIIRQYDKMRDFPAIRGTSKLGVHFRFGTISIREKARKAVKLNGTFLNELIWRDFYMMILGQFPYVTDGPFKKEYARISWRNNEREFDAWCKGKTGYPIVDAGMRELYHTGFMHNRVRMITASFLTKHLLIDWRWGEAWFARYLLDFDLSANNGGWQWAAGCGTDAAPYFRVFNPQLQTERFDNKLAYIRQWVPEFGTDKYPEPIVDHATARERCLAVYKEALSK